VRTIPYRTVLTRALALCGLPYSATETTLLATLSGQVNEAYRRGHELGAWPEWTHAEERAFADEWDDGTGYVTGDIVWYATGEAYYEAVRDNTGVTPGTSVADWTAYTPVDATRYIAWEQSAKNKIGRVWGVFTANPRGTADYRAVAYAETPDGVHVLEALAGPLWIEFSTPAPTFASVVWSVAPATAYARGDVVYYPGSEDGNLPEAGQCYEADIDADGVQVWNTVHFAEVLASYVVPAAAAGLQTYFGKSEQAAGLLERAEQVLQEQATRKIVRRRVTFAAAW
jgi:hypothetical protein